MLYGLRWLVIISQFVKSAVFSKKGVTQGSSFTVAMLGDDEFSRSRISAIRVVNFVPVDKGHEIGVLLN